MMYAVRSFFYNENDQYQVLGVPYKNGDFVMHFILPREHLGLSKFLSQSFNAKKMLEDISRQDMFVIRGDYEVAATIPKFKIETELQLSEILGKLGIRDAFNVEKANFSSMTEENVYVSDVLHKAYIEVSQAFIISV